MPASRRFQRIEDQSETLCALSLQGPKSRAVLNRCCETPVDDIKFFRMAPNVLAGRTIAPEFMQEDCTPENLSAAVLHWFRDPAAADALQPVYRDLHLQLRQGASATAADAVARLAAPALPAPARTP